MLRRRFTFLSAWAVGVTTARQGPWPNAEWNPGPRPGSRRQEGRDMSEAIGQPGQAALPRPLRIGEILSTAFRLYRRHWQTLLAIAAVVVVPLTLRQYLFGDWLRNRGEVTSYQEISTATWAVGAAWLVAGLP